MKWKKQKKRYLLIFPIVILFLIDFSNAAFDLSNCEIYMTHENGTSVDHFGNHDPDTVSDISYATGSGSTGVGQYAIYDGTDDFIEFNNAADVDFVANENFTLMIMLYIDCNSIANTRWIDRYQASTEGFQFYTGAQGASLDYQILYSASTNIQPNCGLTANDFACDIFQLFTWTRNGSTMNYYTNGTRIDSKTNAQCTGDVGGTTNLRIGTRLAGDYDLTGKTDELLICNNRPLTDSEISDAWNNYFLQNHSLYYTEPPPPGASMTLTTNMTAGNYTYNPYVSFSGTVVSTTDNDFNCTFYLNNTPVYSVIPSNISVSSTYQFDYCDDEVGYNINLTCFNSNATDDAVVTDLFLDCVEPVVNLAITTTFTNNSDYYDDTTFSARFEINDSNLFAVNGTIYDTDTLAIENQKFYSNLTIESFQLNFSNSSSSLGIGNHTIEITAWDSHTAAEIPDIIQTIDEYTLLYDNILIQSDKKIKFNKEKDKYTFEIDKKSWLCYITDNEWTKITDYHYIDFSAGHWVDDLSYPFILNSPHEICFYNDKDEVYKTESIGDLNTVTKLYYFTVTAAPDLNELYYPLFYTEMQEINDNVNLIYGVLKMLGFIILWLGLWIFGYHAIQTGNDLVGMTMIVLTVFIDVYFAYAMQEALMVGAGFISVAFGVLAAWTFGMLIFIRRRQYKVLV